MHCRRICCWLLIILSLFGFMPHVCAQSTSGNDAAGTTEGTMFFRDTRWGMTPDEVKQAEPSATFTQIGSYWFMNEPVMIFEQYEASVIYCFFDDGLAVAVAEITKRHEQPTGYLADYEAIKALLTAEYGAANADDIYWISPEYENDPEKALAANAVQYMTNFWLGDTVIELILGPSSQNGQSVVTVQYADAGIYADMF